MYKTFLLYLACTLLFTISSCMPSDSSTEDSITPPQNWINDRVSQARERLQSSDAGKKLWQAIEAHGGLERWYSNGPLQFHFNYQPLDGSTVRNTLQVVNQWSAQARHQLVADTTVQFGWDGQQAWATDTAKVPFDVRFWSLTPYYFVGIPFVLADEGIHLEEAGEDTYEGQRYDLVRITFGEGIGDAPDDYYVIYINQENQQVGVIRYVVSYPGYFPEGGHTPEKLMALQGLQIVDGISLAKGYKTYWWKEEQAGEHITNITVSAVDFLPELPKGYFEAPEGVDVVGEM